MGQGSVKGGLQADGVQRDPAGAHVLVGAQQVGAAIGTHAVALAEVAIGIGQGLVGTGHRLGGTDGRDAQLGTTGAEVGHHFLQGGGNGIGGGEIEQVETATQVVQQEVVRGQTESTRIL